MEGFGPGGNFPEKVVHLQRWSSLTGRSVQLKLALPISKILISSPTSLRRNGNFGPNVNGMLWSG